MLSSKQTENTRTVFRETTSHFLWRLLADWQKFNGFKMTSPVWPTLSSVNVKLQWIMRPDITDSNTKFEFTCVLWWLNRKCWWQDENKKKSDRWKGCQSLKWFCGYASQSARLAAVPRSGWSMGVTRPIQARPHLSPRPLTPRAVEGVTGATLPGRHWEMVYE